MSGAVIVPWALVVMAFVVELIAIAGQIRKHRRWRPKPDKSPREAREAGRRMTQNVTVPVFSGVGVAAGLLGSWLLPHGATLGDPGLISFAAVLMLICAALQALVNWVAVVDDPGPEAFYVSPERIYLGIQELNVEDESAPQELATMRRARESWRAEFGARTVLSIHSIRCAALNESLAWVPPVSNLGFRDACRIREVLRIMRARQKCVYVRWVRGVVAAYVALALILLSCLVAMLQVQRLWFWILAIVVLIFLWGVLDFLAVVRHVRKLARQKFFDSQLTDAFRVEDLAVAEAEKRRRLAAEQEAKRLNRIEDTVVRIEQRLARKTTDRCPHRLTRFLTGRWR